jgi:hypothetical protein
MLQTALVLALWYPQDARQRRFNRWPKFDLSLANPGTSTRLGNLLRSKGLSPRASALVEVSTVRSLDVVFPVKNYGLLRLRFVAPNTQTSRQLLAELGLTPTGIPKIIQNAVEKIRLSKMVIWESRLFDMRLLRILPLGIVHGRNS